MSDVFRIHSFKNKTEKELWEAVEELKRMVEGELEWREIWREERQAKKKDEEVDEDTLPERKY